MKALRIPTKGKPSKTGWLISVRQSVLFTLATIDLICMSNISLESNVGPRCLWWSASGTTTLLKNVLEWLSPQAAARRFSSK